MSGPGVPISRQSDQWTPKAAAHADKYASCFLTKGGRVNKGAPGERQGRRKRRYLPPPRRRGAFERDWKRWGQRHRVENKKRKHDKGIALCVWARSCAGDGTMAMVGIDQSNLLLSTTHIKIADCYAAWAVFSLLLPWTRERPLWFITPPPSIWCI